MTGEAHVLPAFVEESHKCEIGTARLARRLDAHFATNFRHARRARQLETLLAGCSPSLLPIHTHRHDDVEVPGPHTKINSFAASVDSAARNDRASHNRGRVHWRIEQRELPISQTKQLPRFAAVLDVVHEQAGKTITGSKLGCSGNARLKGLLILNRIGGVADLELRLILHGRSKRLAGYCKSAEALLRCLNGKCHRNQKHRKFHRDADTLCDGRKLCKLADCCLDSTMVHSRPKSPARLTSNFHQHRIASHHRKGRSYARSKEIFESAVGGWRGHVARNRTTCPAAKIQIHVEGRCH